MKPQRNFGALMIFAVSVCMQLVVAAQAITPEQVPDEVKQGLQEKFPTVKQAEWKIKADKSYEAEFTLNGTEIAAKFDSTGKWLETESAISRFKVPKSVRDAASRKIGGYKVVERQSVQRWNEERLIYELHLENSNEIVKAQFTEDGKVLSQSAKARPAKRILP